MLQKNAAPPELINALNALMALPSLSGHCLVGGTALALQIGHRISVDIDLFSFKKNLFADIIENELIKQFSKNNISEIKYFPHGISAIINGKKVDIFDWDEG